MGRVFLFASAKLASRTSGCSSRQGVGGILFNENNFEVKTYSGSISKVTGTAIDLQIGLHVVSALRTFLKPEDEVILCMSDDALSPENKAQFQKVMVETEGVNLWDLRLVVGNENSSEILECCMSAADACSLGDDTKAISIITGLGATLVY